MNDGYGIVDYGAARGRMSSRRSRGVEGSVRHLKGMSQPHCYFLQALPEIDNLTQGPNPAQPQPRKSIPTAATRPSSETLVGSSPTARRRPADARRESLGLAGSLRRSRFGHLAIGLSVVTLLLRLNGRSAEWDQRRPADLGAHPLSLRARAMRTRYGTVADFDRHRGGKAKGHGADASNPDKLTVQEAYRKHRYVERGNIYSSSAYVDSEYIEGEDPLPKPPRRDLGDFKYNSAKSKRLAGTHHHYHSRADLQQLADSVVMLVPIRLDLEVEGVRLRDAFTWNLNGETRDRVDFVET
ncbi:hypothetical protein BDK51DRAFT_40430 [Blyttiomyces helicus]|uniref:Uncharacterized protein n=1 Tax=Blyttiomyces helicus TaxID=388810 RepID=A0A4P9W1S2_9FUNG|nr:hypothetical protein BDK51DRAFT_40430 [Blyttiomyces helicus]|eukprot:RKO85632.1 hypothetical protein BDK51DRAFT_40430 [Blyttiomyces helicus]